MEGRLEELVQLWLRGLAEEFLNTLLPSLQHKAEKATEVAMRVERVVKQLATLDAAATSGLAREFSCAHKRSLRRVFPELNFRCVRTCVWEPAGETLEKILQASEELPLIGAAIGLMNGSILPSFSAETCWFQRFVPSVVFRECSQCCSVSRHLQAGQGCEVQQRRLLEIQPIRPGALSFQSHLWSPP